jgi:hypothetical protein
MISISYKLQHLQQIEPPSNSLFVWLVAGADLCQEKSTVDWLLVADLF